MNCFEPPPWNSTFERSEIVGVEFGVVDLTESAEAAVEQPTAINA